MMLPVENIKKCDPKDLLKLKSCGAARFLDAYGMWLRDADGNHVPFDWTNPGPYYVRDAEYQWFGECNSGFFQKGDHFLARE